MKRIIKSVFIVLFVTVIMSACGKSDAKVPEVVGTWQYSKADTYTITYSFDEYGMGNYIFTSVDETGEEIVEETPFTYTLDDDRIIIMFDEADDAYELTYDIDGTLLTIKDPYNEEIFLDKALSNN